MTDLDKAVERLLTQRAAFLEQIEINQKRVFGLEAALEVLGRPVDPEEIAPPARPPSVSSRRQNVSEVLVSMLREAGAAGINARRAARLAAARGIDLNIRTVSSLLSRMKKAGVVVYDNRAYALAAAVAADRSSAVAAA